MVPASSTITVPGMATFMRTIPVLTFVVERWVTRTYIDPALAAADAQPTVSASPQASG